MPKGFFEGLKEGMNEIKEKLPEELKQDDKSQKKQIKEKKLLESTIKEVYNLLGKDEEVLYVHPFLKNKMVVTNKKLIYIDVKTAKNKTFAMIPFNKITSYSLLVPTGLSVKGKLAIFTGGDKPSLEIESVLNDGMNEFCRILADHI